MRRARICFALVFAFSLLAPLGARRAVPDPYRILVSNDDGVGAPGIAALAQALQAIGDVTIVAPAENQTGAGHSVVTTQPVYRDDVTLPNGMKAIGLSTTPASTMNIAIHNIVKPMPDLVVTGVNRGYNLGLSVYLSGTTAGAREAAMAGIPAIASSLAEAGFPGEFDAAAAQVLTVARRVKEHGLPRYSFLNVNVPQRPAGGYKGVQVTTLAMMRGGVETFAETTRPGTGRRIYWSVYKEGIDAPQGTDIWGVNHGYVSVTPLKVGETDPSMLETLRRWFP